MDTTSRGRSPSASLQHKAFTSRSPSAHSFHDASATLDPSFLQNNNNNTNQSQNFQSSFSGLDNPTFDLSDFNDQTTDTSFLSHGSSQLPNLDISDLDLINTNDLSSYTDSNLFNDTNNQSLDPSNMATMHQQFPQQSQYFSQDYQQHLQMNGQQTSPSLAQNGFDSTSAFQQDPRRTSLDPSSAWALSANGSWNGEAFQKYQHRRTPSDYSDISSSAQPSPNLGEMDSFDNGPHSSYHSPLLQPSDPSMQSAFGLEQFSIGGDINSMPGPSPGHSPHISPHLQPQHQGLEQFQPHDSYMLAGGNNNQMYQGNMFSQQDLEAFPSMTSNGGSPGLEQNGAMSPPIINVVSVPDRQPTGNASLQHRDSVGALSPPLRHHAGRHRTPSDPSHNSRGSSRSTSPAARARSPSLGVPQMGSLAPQISSGASSRSTSPSPNPNGIVKSRRYSSPDRERVLEMADPSRAASNASSSPSFVGEQSTGSDTNRRVQKHPAIFSCHLCTKRFTRAYNLRSHLRTHTDERPFVCSVCGKAFARQHDRKRHEGLHTGEKKFVCRGTCSSADGGSMQWGCGRRFARADALGRHFRSEAGRACIKPLMDEEARERQQDQIDQANQGLLDSDMFAGQNPQMKQGQQAQQMPQVSFNGMPLPQALLQQYPALAEIQWSQVPGAAGVTAGDDNDDFGASPRSSFEASEFEEEGEYLSGEAENFGGQSSTQWMEQPGQHGQSNWS